MTDAELVAFLEWAVRRLGLRWRGIAHFRSTVRKRLTKRMAELGLGDLEAYRARVESDTSEEDVLQAMCRIPISRLYRDAGVFDLLGAALLPERARIATSEGRSAVRAWSAGCASGEEPYSVAMVWNADVAPVHPNVAIEILATDADDAMLERAKRGVYGGGSVRELPSRLRDVMMRREGSSFVVTDDVRHLVTFVRQDLTRAMPPGMFDVVLCRNMLLTYVSEERQRVLLDELVARLWPGGSLVVGSRETMPPDVLSVERDARAPGVFRKTDQRYHPRSR